MPKTLYHSKLAALGPTRVKVKGDVTPSKFKDKLPFVTVEIDGEEYYLCLENADCEAFFDGQKGQTFTLQAEGSREGASFQWLGESADTAGRDDRPRGNPPPKQQEQRRDPPQQREAAPKGNRPPPAVIDKAVALGHLKVHVGRNSGIAKVAMRATRQMILELIETKDEVYAHLAGNEAFHVALFNCCCYGTHTTKWLEHVPVNVAFPSLEVEAAKPKGAAAPPRQNPPRQPAPEERQPSDNDGGATEGELRSEAEQPNF